MYTKKIYCSGCELYLGEINKATLRKNISFLCEKCEKLRYINHKSNKLKPSSDPFSNVFSDIFGGTL